ncbi:thiaminase (transcriptional activator TenA) [Filimonas lacunae]|uniref:Thiaminase (Transcriptional activator TenA) n=1 Tax=Filimonas lacunae TaxID=477680 RepID=A0A173MCA6_9BACT|nr:TenA family protein [Filimonas lacunae]BAV05140.1 thiaminase II [Filimonas lacunae]SIT34164.1 thiaminase (transcriptional activator TenA) [Filimonas lacunae]
MQWSKQAWQQITPLFEKIVQLPFNQELMNGSLTKDRFAFYIGQDAVYLDAFSKVLALIAARAPRTQQSLDFIRFAEGAIVVEQALHAGFFSQLQIPEKPVASPGCLLYTQYLYATAALQQVEVAMAAVLPCFWIYKAVGDYIYAHQVRENNPYQDWIDTYAGEDFGITVQKAIDICDAAAAACTPAQQQQMTEAFIMASRMEWMFWHSAWNREQWPV